MLTPLRLKKHEERRLLQNHPWIYSNEVDVQKTPLTQFIPGQQVIIESYQGNALGSGYINPHSLICTRIIDRNPAIILDKNLLIERLKTALHLRDQLFDQPFYRLVFGESDYLPGLIIDRYGDVLVVQITTTGMENVKNELKAALEEVLKPQAILLRNDTNSRKLEGLEQYISPLYGEPPKHIKLVENHTEFLIPIYEGQKTGWFYDQRINRTQLKHYVKDKRVLDVFSYIGAWGIQAAQHGASEVLCVDSSAQALDWLQENAKLNKLENKVRTLQADAFNALNDLHEAREKFDVIILDPPAFMKRRKDTKEGLLAYRRLNELALRLFNKAGILITASCSMHLQHNNFITLLNQASSKRQMNLQILAQGHQASDHPLHPALPETNYLKAFFAYIS